MTNSAVGALRVAGCVALVWASGCLWPRQSPPPSPRWDASLPTPRIDGDTGTTDTIARGALHRAFLVRQGPWAVHVLDIDRAMCWSPVATKGTPGAAGRARTSSLAAWEAGQGREVAGAVNADFFLFDPAGVPTGAHVRQGAVVTGPGTRPVLALTRDGRPWTGVLSVAGSAVSAIDTIAIVSWNRLSATGLAWFDAQYGAAVDTMTGSIRVVVREGTGAVQVIDTGRARTSIPSSGGVLVLGPRAPTPVRERFLLAARARGRFAVTVGLEPLHPVEAVGGFPILVRDSLEVPGLDSAGAPGFAPVRHPRTIVGIAAQGRRLLLITIDGRQPGYSAGATNRESARIALSLGATEAINLDGGGSTTMVVSRPGNGGQRFEVVNRPSDPQGERAVGNALVVTRDPRFSTRDIRCRT